MVPGGFFPPTFMSSNRAGEQGALLCGSSARTLRSASMLWFAWGLLASQSLWAVAVGGRTTVSPPAEYELGCFAGDILGDKPRMGGFLEYRPSCRPFFTCRWQAGLYCAAPEGVYGCMGLRRCWEAGQWTLVVSSHVGLFESGGRSVLGHPVEFLSYLQVERRLSAAWRLGLGFGHISNAHLGRRNPGSELLRISLIR